MTVEIKNINIIDITHEDFYILLEDVIDTLPTGTFIIDEDNYRILITNEAHSILLNNKVKFLYN